MDDLTGVLGVLTGLTFIVMSLGIAFWAIYWNYQKKRLQYHERQLMIERGLTPPPILPEDPKRVSPEDSLRRGLVLLFLGIGLGIAWAVLSRPVVDDAPPAWLAGVAAAVVGFLGLGHLAYYLIARRATPPADRAEMPTSAA